MSLDPLTASGGPIDFQEPSWLAPDDPPAWVLHEPRLSSSASGRYETTKPDEFAEFEDLSEPGWDGYDARPISRATIEAARNFYRSLPIHGPRPDIAPASDGTIGFQWEVSGGGISDLFVEVGPGDLVGGSWVEDGSRRIQPTRQYRFTMYNLGSILNRLLPNAL